MLWHFQQSEYCQLLTQREFYLFQQKTVHADDIVAVGNVDHKVNLSLVGYDKNRGVSVTFSIDSVNPNFVNNWNSKQDSIIVRTKLVNAKTKEVVDNDTGASVRLRSYDLTKAALTLIHMNRFLMVNTNMKPM